MGFADFVEGFTEGFVPTFANRMAAQEKEDADLAKVMFERRSQLHQTRAEADREARERARQSEGLFRTLGVGDPGIYYRMQDMGYKPNEIVTMVRENPNLFVEMGGLSPEDLNRPNAVADILSRNSGPTVQAGQEVAALDAGTPATTGLIVSPGTRAEFAPDDNFLNISMDFNAAPSGNARGTEVIIPDNAGPEVRAAAERFNELVADFARSNGIEDYPVRGVRTTSENGRGVRNTVHAEPFFNNDADMQRIIATNPTAFAQIYEQAFGGLTNARLIAPHGVGNDRGAASDIFGDETTFGELMARSLRPDGTVARGNVDPTDIQMADSGLIQTDATAGPPDNAFSTLLGVNQAQRDRDISARVDRLSEAAGISGEPSSGFAVPQTNFRLNTTATSELPNIGKVLASNYQALAAQAERAGDPALAADIMRIGEEMSSATPERRAVIQDAIDRVGTAISRADSRVRETQGAVNGFLAATDSAYNMISILQEQPDILTFFGGNIPRFLSNVENEVNAFSSVLGDLSTTDGTPEQIQAAGGRQDAAIDAYVQRVEADIASGAIEARAAAYARYSAQEVRMAYMIVRSQQPTGPISQADFEAAFQQVRTSRNPATVEDSLRGIISRDRINVTSMQDTLRNDPQIYGAYRTIELAELTDYDPLQGLLRPIEEVAEARGVGDALRWLSGETNLIQRPGEETQQPAPEQPAPQTEQQGQATRTGTLVTPEMAEQTPSLSRFVGQQVIAVQQEDGTYALEVVE